MADLPDLIRNKSNCPKCKAVYSDKVTRKRQGLSNFPRIIPDCNHNICESCVSIQGRRYGQVSCGVCEAVAAWSATELENYPRDFYLMGSLTYHRQEESIGNDSSVNFSQVTPLIDEFMCEECDRRLAIWVCETCRSNFCSECFNIVHDSKTMVQHQRITIQDGARDILKLMLSKFSYHGKYTNLTSNDDRSTVNESNLDEMILRGRNTLLKLKSAHKTLQKDNKVNPYANLQQQIKVQFNSYHRKLQMLQHQLELQINEVEKSEIDLIARLIDSSSARIKEVASLLRIAHLVRQHMTKSVNVSKLTSFLQDLEEEPCVVFKTAGCMDVQINQQFGELLQSGVALSQEEKFKIELIPFYEAPLDIHDASSLSAEINIPIINTTNSNVNIPPKTPFYLSAANSNNNLSFPNISIPRNAKSNRSSSSQSTTACSLTVNLAEDGKIFYDRNSILSLKHCPESLIQPNFGEVIPGFHDVFLATSQLPTSGAALSVPKQPTDDAKDGKLLFALKSRRESLIQPKIEEVIPAENDPSKSKKIFVCAKDVQKQETIIDSVAHEVTSVDKNLVIVCHIISPGKFFVQFIHLLNELNQVMDKMRSLENENSPSFESLEVGSLVVARSSLDQQLYRGSIVSINTISNQDVKVEINFIDYGNIEFVKLSDLRILPKNIGRNSPFTKECALFGINPNADGAWSDSATESFKELSNSPLLLVEINQIGITSYVDLCKPPSKDFGQGSPSSIRNLLVSQNMAKFSTPLKKSADSREMWNFFSQDSLKEGENYRVFISHISDPSSFAVQLIGEHRIWATCLGKMIDEMQTTYKAIDHNWNTFTPNVGMVCAAIYSIDEKYYRARIICEVSRSQFEVEFVDFGNCEVVHCSQLRKLIDKFRKIPAMAIHVSLSDILPIGKAWTVEETRALKLMTQFKELLMHVESSQGKEAPYQVYIYETMIEKDICVNASLVNKGFANSKSGINLQVEYPKLDATLSENHNKKKKVQKPIQSLSLCEKELKLHQGCPEPSINAMSDNRLLHSQSNISCRVTHVVSPSRLYILNLEDSEQFSLFTTDLGNALNSKCKVKMEDPCYVGQTCAARDESKVWARGKIVNLKSGDVENSSVATVFFFDSGKVQEVSTHPDYLCNLPGQFSIAPPFSKPVHISNIQPTGGTYRWSASASEKLKSWLEAVEHIVTFKNDGPIVIDESSGLSSQPVQLFVEKVTDMGPLEPLKREDVSLSEKLRKRGLALPPMNSETIKKTLSITENVEINVDISMPMLIRKSTTVVEDLKKHSEAHQGESPIKTFTWKIKPMEESVFLGITTHVDIKGNIYIQPKQNRETVETIKHILNCKYKDTKPKPHDLYWFPNQCCIAQFDVDKNWCRGKVLRQLDKDLFEVLFVDFGNTEKVPAGKLRKNLFVQQIPEQCFKMKLGEIDFCESAEKLNRKVLGFVDELLVDQTVQVTITKREPLVGNLKTLAGWDVADHLVQNGYAVRKKKRVTKLSSSGTDPELSLTYKMDTENNNYNSANFLHTISEHEESIAENESAHCLNKCTTLLSGDRGADSDLGKFDCKIDSCKLDGDNNVQESFGNGCDSLNLEWETEDDTDDYFSDSDSDIFTSNDSSIPDREGSMFSVVYLGQQSKDIIYCRLVDDDQTPYPTSFKTLSDQLQLIGDKQKMMLKRPLKDEVVIARNTLDRKWCRAVMTDPSTMTAEFIDYGNSSVVDEIRKLPPGMYTLPKQAIRLRIVGEINLQSLVALETLVHCRLIKLEQDGVGRSPIASVEIIPKTIKDAKN